MARTISIGAQGFEDIRANGYFYVDKTGFVRDWWLSGDVADLVARGIDESRIHTFGIAFRGKEVLVG